MKREESELMRTYMRSISYSALIPFLFVFVLHGLVAVTPVRAEAKIWSLVGALSGALIVGSLAAAFGPVGMIAAAVLGGGIGFFIGAVLFGWIGSQWGMKEAIMGMMVGGMLGAVVGGALMVAAAASSPVIGIFAGGLLGANIGSSMAHGLTSDDDEGSPAIPWNGLVPADVQKVMADDDRNTVSKDSNERFGLATLKERCVKAMKRLQAAVSTVDEKLRHRAYDEYGVAQRDYYRAREANLAK